MNKWEIQQRIRNLESRINELESEISRLEEKRDRIELEHSRKSRQISQVSSFYSTNRTNAGLLYDGVQGVAVSKAAERFGNIYSATDEENLISNLRNAQSYLKKNCEKIDELIESARSDIASLNWQIYSYKIDLENEEEAL